MSQFDLFKNNAYHADSCKPSFDIEAIDVKISQFDIKTDTQSIKTPKTQSNTLKEENQSELDEQSALSK